MAKLHQVLFGSGLLVCVQLAQAQQAADVSVGPQGPASVQVELPGNGGADQDTSGASAAPGGYALGVIVETAPPTQAQSRPGFDTDDPLIQRREARAQARADYRARVRQARQQLREEQRAADAALLERQGATSGQ